MKPKSALDEAREFAAAGDYAKSLERHEWFHDHGLAHEPSMYGVRLSFALYDWVELGGKYPPALEKLHEVRKRKTAALLRGERSRELFHDVASINEKLGLSSDTVDLFKQIERSAPEFAEHIYDICEADLITADEFQLARKYLGSPDRRFDSSAANYREGILYAATMARNSEVSRAAFETIFIEDTLRTITVLEKTGGAEDAKRIRERALSILDHPRLREGNERNMRILPH